MRLPIKRIILSQDVNIFYDTGTFDLDNGFFVQYSGSIDVEITKHIAINILSVKTSTPIQPLNDHRKTEIVGGAGVTFTF